MNLLEVTWSHRQR